MILAIDRWSKIIWLSISGHDNIPMPIGALDNDTDFLIKLTDIIISRWVDKIVIWRPKNPTTRTKIEKFITELGYIFVWEIFKMDEEYTSIQAKNITSIPKKSLANDVVASMIILQRYLDSLN